MGIKFPVVVGFYNIRETGENMYYLILQEMYPDIWIRISNVFIKNFLLLVY